MAYEIMLKPGDTVQFEESVYECVESPDDPLLGNMCTVCDMYAAGECRLPRKYNCFPNIMKKEQ